MNDNHNISGSETIGKYPEPKPGEEQAQEVTSRGYFAAKAGVTERRTAESGWTKPSDQNTHDLAQAERIRLSPHDGKDRGSWGME